MSNSVPVSAAFKPSLFVDDDFSFESNRDNTWNQNNMENSEESKASYSRKKIRNEVYETENKNLPNYVQNDFDRRNRVIPGLTGSSQIPFSNTSNCRKSQKRSIDQIPSSNSSNGEEKEDPLSYLPDNSRVRDASNDINSSASHLPIRVQPSQIAFASLPPNYLIPTLFSNHYQNISHMTHGQRDNSNNPVNTSIIPPFYHSIYPQAQFSQFHHQLSSSQQIPCNNHQPNMTNPIPSDKPIPSNAHPYSFQSFPQMYPMAHMMMLSSHPKLPTIRPLPVNNQIQPCQLQASTPTKSQSLDNRDTDSLNNNSQYHTLVDKKKKIRSDRPHWLESFGEACHSESQRNSGKNLSKIKKKYRLMRCTYCSEYNSNDSPWSTLKYRKFESENFSEHERSTHHIKAVIRRCTALSEPFPLSFRSVSDDNTHDDTTPPSSESHESAPSSQKTSNSKNSFVVSDGSHMIEKQKQIPLWLKCEGRLCHSDNQIASGENLDKVKKKYKNIMCTYCCEFNPLSPWAKMKARKYEAAVLNEHERSHHHAKAVCSRNVYEGSISFDSLGVYHPQNYAMLNNVTNESISDSMLPAPGSSGIGNTSSS